MARTRLVTRLSGRRDSEKASYEQLIAELRAQILAAQQAGAGTPDTHDYDEAQTSRDLIDLVLRKSGWALDQNGSPRARDPRIGQAVCASRGMAVARRRVSTSCIASRSSSENNSSGPRGAMLLNGES